MRSDDSATPVGHPWATKRCRTVAEDARSACRMVSDPSAPPKDGPPRMAIWRAVFVAVVSLIKTSMLVGTAGEAIADGTASSGTLVGRWSFSGSGLHASSTAARAGAIKTDALVEWKR